MDKPNNLTTPTQLPGCTHVAEIIIHYCRGLLLSISDLGLYQVLPGVLVGASDGQSRLKVCDGLPVLLTVCIAIE